MTRNHFPARIRALPPFSGPVAAYRLAGEGCEVLFASYPAGTEITPHAHETENCGCITEGELILITHGEERRYGVGDWYHLRPGESHAARFEVDTSEIEFWFEAADPVAAKHDVRHDEAGGRFVLELGGDEAVLEYARQPSGKYDYRRTFVPPSFRGRGLATQLVRFALDHARQQKWTIVPSCPFVAQVMDRFPQYAELASDPSG